MSYILEIDGDEYTVHQETYLEYVNKAENSNKFWCMSVVEDDHGNFANYTTYGRIGSKGQSGMTEFSNELEATASYAHAVKDKKKKGYVEVAKPTVISLIKVPAVPFVETEWDLT